LWLHTSICHIGVHQESNDESVEGLITNMDWCLAGLQNDL
jgi:hypothetical protein